MDPISSQKTKPGRGGESEEERKREGGRSDERLIEIRSRSSSMSSTASVEGRGLRRPREVAIGDDDRREVGGAKRSRKTPSSEIPLLNIGASSSKSKKESGPSVEDLQNEMMMLPTAEIAAEVLRHLEEVNRVATRSTNLKGTFVKALKTASRAVGVAVNEIHQRTVASTSPAALQAENAQLRKEVADLREDLGRLREVMRGLSESHELAVAEAPSTSTLRSSASTAVARQVKERGEFAPPPLPIDKDALLAQIGALIDGRLATFKEELLRDSPVFRSAGGNVEEEKKKKSKKKEGRKRTDEGETRPPRVSVSEDQEGECSQTTKAQQSAAAEASEGDWATVTRRKVKATKKAAKGGEAAAHPTKKKPAGRGKAAAKPSSTDGQGKEKGGGKAAATLPQPTKKKAGAVRLKRPPRTAAVAITIAEGSKATYAEIMRTARDKVDLTALKIEKIRPRRSITGGYLLEIPGEDKTEKADMLARKLARELGPMGVRINRPMRTVEVRVAELDDSVTPANVGEAIARLAEVSERHIKVGKIRRSASGLGTAWVRCPESAARLIKKEGRLKIGWSSARVDILEPRPLRCYRCMELGHVGQRCPKSNPDRHDRCYRCGEKDHLAEECEASVPRCPLCSDLGRPAAHKLGAKSCAPAPQEKKKEGGPAAAKKKAQKGATAVAPEATAEEETSTMEVVQED